MKTLLKQNTLTSLLAAQYNATPTADLMSNFPIQHRLNGCTHLSYTVCTLPFSTFALLDKARGCVLYGHSNQFSAVRKPFLTW